MQCYPERATEAPALKQAKHDILEVDSIWLRKHSRQEGPTTTIFTIILFTNDVLALTPAQLKFNLQWATYQFLTQNYHQEERQCA